jgi:hypothetical protein
MNDERFRGAAQRIIHRSSFILHSSLSMAAKKSFVLRIDEATFAALEKWAADEFRSVNGQLEWLLNQALKEAGRERVVKPPAAEASEAGAEVSSTETVAPG